MPKQTKKTIHYVDNKKFYEVMVDYITKYRAWDSEVQKHFDVFLETVPAADKRTKKKVKLLRKEFDKQYEKTKPVIPTYAAEAVTKIAQRLATKPNFARYHFVEEMVDDGIMNCIQYMHDFDPEKGSNPFSYFTQFIYFAFFRRIEKEEKEMNARLEHRERSLAELAVQSPQAFSEMLEREMTRD